MTSKKKVEEKVEEKAEQVDPLAEVRRYYQALATVYAVNPDLKPSTTFTHLGTLIELIADERQDNHRQVWSLESQLDLAEHKVAHLSQLFASIVDVELEAE